MRRRRTGWWQMPVKRMRRTSMRRTRVMATWQLPRHRWWVEGGRHWRNPFGVAALAVLLVTLATPGLAMAHATIDVGDGRYVMEVGFRDEPAYLGLPNALYLKVEEYATGGTQPVDDLAATLSVEVAKDGQTLTLPLVPRGDGEYEMAFVPTATGDYTFHISGTIGDAPVDESVTSGPN